MQDQFADFGAQDNQVPQYNTDDMGDIELDDPKSNNKVRNIALLLFGVGIVIAIALYALGGLSIKDKGETAEGTETSEVVETEGTEVADEVTADVGEESTQPYEEETAEQPATEALQPDEQSTGVSSETVENVEFEGEYSATGTVSKKYTVKDGIQYQFVLEILLINDSGSASIQYFTTKDAYDGIVLGDRLEVSYTGDGAGGLALTGISR